MSKKRKIRKTKSGALLRRTTACAATSASSRPDSISDMSCGVVAARPMENLWH